MGAIVVTGASSGIGQAVAVRAAREGYFVVGIDQHRSWTDDSTRQLILGDVTDAETIEAAASAAAQRGLSGWVNNAALALPGEVVSLNRQDVQRMLSVNLEAYIWGCQAAVRLLRAQNSPGSIVNISSIQAKVGFPSWSVYASTKGGVDALTRTVAVECGADGIRCNSVSPGNIATPLASSVADTDTQGEVTGLMERMAPLGRMGQPEEIAAVVMFLIGSDSSFITGENLVVDGGASARCIEMPPRLWPTTRLSGGT